jgi:CRP-like cAMP-binding protein
VAAPAARQLLRECPDFAAAFVEELAAAHRATLRELKNFRTRSGFQRLVAWMVAMQEEAGIGEVVLPCRKAVLADRLGIKPETLSRDLARLAGLGVSIQGRRFRIEDIAALRRLAAMDDHNGPCVP